MTLHPKLSPTGTEGDDGRRTLLAIAPARFVRHLEQLVDVPIETPENIFDAVGEMLLGKPARDAATLIVASDELRSAPEATVATLRTLAPAMRIVALVATTNGTARTAPHPLEDVVDVVLYEPVTDAELRRALGERDIPGSAASAAEDTQVETESSAPPSGAANPSAPADLHQPTVASAPPEVEPAFAAPAPDVAENSEPIGDTDLIQEIMFGPDALAARALTLIRQQTGWGDVRLVDRVEEHGAAVEFAGDRFGFLIAPEGEVDAVSEWANWLARWLALDRAYREYRQLTFRDDLTGAWNRRFFDAFLTQSIRQAGERRRPITVMVFDLDHFKRYNDEFGHEAGDEILRETVKLMQSVIRKGDRVCRIGGDEFAVVFADIEGPREAGSQHPDSVEEIASRFQNQISLLKFPKLGTEAPGTLSISAGLATYPWDGTNPQELLRKADELAMQSKRRGKNVITFGPGAAEACKRKE